MYSCLQASMLSFASAAWQTNACPGTPPETLAKLVKNSTLKVYPDLPHGMCTTNPDEINADFLAFFQHSRMLPHSAETPEWR